VEDGLWARLVWNGSGCIVWLFAWHAWFLHGFYVIFNEVLQLSWLVVYTFAWIFVANIHYG